MSTIRHPETVLAVAIDEAELGRAIVRLLDTNINIVPGCATVKVEKVETQWGSSTLTLYVVSHLP